MEHLEPAISTVSRRGRPGSGRLGGRERRQHLLLPRCGICGYSRWSGVLDLTRWASITRHRGYSCKGQEQIIELIREKNKNWFKQSGGKCASSKLVDDARKEELRAEKAAAEVDDGF